MLQQELSPIFSETLALPSSDLPPLPFLFLHSWCYFKLRRPAKICTLLITCQLLCAMFNALPRLHQVCSESRRLTAAWVPGRLDGGPTVMHRGLLSPPLALNSVSRPSPDPACRPFKDGTAPTSCYTQHSDGQVGKFASLENVKGLRTAEPNKCIGHKVRLIGK